MQGWLDNTPTDQGFYWVLRADTQSLTVVHLVWGAADSRTVQPALMLSQGAVYVPGAADRWYGPLDAPDMPTPATVP